MNALTFACCSVLAGLVAAGSVTSAQVASKEKAKPRFDIRFDDPGARAAVQARLALPDARMQRRSAAEMQRASPGLSVEFHEILGTPSFIRSSGAFLTGEANPAAWLETLRGYVAEHRDIFGVEASVLDRCRLSRNLLTEHNGVRSVTLQEQVDGYDLVGAALLASFNSSGQLINVASTLIPIPGGPIPAGSAVRTAQDAIRAAALDLGMAMSAMPPVPAGGAPSARRAIFPLNRLDLRPAWVTLVPEPGTGNLYEVTLDAEDGRVLRRLNLTLHATSATYNVYTRSAADSTPADSPSPRSPTSCTPGVTQPPLITRSSQAIISLSAAASPNGWIDPLDNATSGNNVSAHTPAAPPVMGSSFRVFDFPLDLTSPPAGYTSAAVTQLFYDVSWIHDRLYQLGFDEPSGNYQRSNFGRGGLEEDAIDAIAQDSGSNNAFFVPAPDGATGSLHMFVFTGPDPDRDGDLDAEVIIHESGHALSTRLVDDLSALQATGMGEGWSDFYSLSLLSQAADDPRGCYAEAAYVAYQLFGLTQNYTFGIRRFPYSADRTKNPETFADIDPSQMAFDPAIPSSPLIGSVIDTRAEEEHNVG